MKTTRGLSTEFMDDFKTGILKPILNLVKKDDTLCLQIRNDYVNVYYRGGNIMDIKRNKNSYISSFNLGYFKLAEVERKNSIIGKLPKNITNEEQANKWVENIPFIKQIMDEYFTKYSKNEREYQQLIARENNNSVISNETDYFITDIEYTHTDSKDSRFDLIGIKWESTSQKRQNPNNCRLVIIEMKYGDGAITGKAGIKKHLEDVEKFCGNQNNLDTLKEATVNLFMQLRELGLVRFGKDDNSNKIEKLSDNKPEFILIFANHKPAKSKLSQEFKELREIKFAEVKIATANFMGYGLYDKNIISLKDFIVQFNQ